jgi:hypothetical protein
MTVDKDLCSRRNTSFNGRQRFLSCAGPCASLFHEACLWLASNEYSICIVNAESNYRTSMPPADYNNLAGTMTLFSRRSWLMVVSSQEPRHDLQDLSVPTVNDTQINRKLHDIALKLCGESRTLSKGSESLNIKLAHILTLCVDYSGVNLPWSSTICCSRGLRDQSYRDVLTTDSISRFSSSADSSNPRGKAVTSAKNVVYQAGICDEGFKKVFR